MEDLKVEIVVFKFKAFSNMEENAELQQEQIQQKLDEYVRKSYTLVSSNTIFIGSRWVTQLYFRLI